MWLALLVVLIWGFNFVVITTGLLTIPPVFLAFSRFFLTSIPLIFFIKRPAVPLKMLMIHGFIMFALQFSLLFIGMKLGVTPALASILQQLQVFFTLFLAAFIFGERITKLQILGALVAFSGIAVLGLNIGGEFTLLGFLILVVSAACFSVGNILAKKMGKIDMTSLVIWASFFAWPPLLLLSFLFEGPEKIGFFFSHLSWKSVGSVLYIGYFSTLLAFATWSGLVQRHQLASIAPFTLLVPFFGILFSALFIGEPLQTWKIGAALLVVAGLCIHLFGSRLNKKVDLPS